jgi:hypothetical protein
MAALGAVDSAAALQAVLAAGGDPHPRVAYEAIVALGRFVSAPETVRAALMTELTSADLYRRSAAMLGLVEFLEPAHTDELEAMLQRLWDTEPGPELRAWAAWYRVALERVPAAWGRPRRVAATSASAAANAALLEMRT